MQIVWLLAGVGLATIGRCLARSFCASRSCPTCGESAESIADLGYCECGHYWPDDFDEAFADLPYCEGS
jgi:hypothetical protein